ncbi:MAG: hypothetical protein JWP61_1807, partial [Friedmanniella sp.]|nr:hypothetical protein [Friedmanniella sp.]
MKTSGRAAGDRAGRTRWWSRSRGLPAAAYASWLASAAAQPGAGPTRILAWGRAGDQLVIGGPALLSWGGVDGWQHLGWHEIERGGWEAADGRLTWRRYDGEPEHLALSEPGRVPELFRERVAASIAVEKLIALKGDRGVIVTARRHLGTGGELSWHATLSSGLSWSTPGVTEAAADAL